MTTIVESTTQGRVRVAHKAQLRTPLIDSFTQDDLPTYMYKHTHTDTQYLSSVNMSCTCSLGRLCLHLTYKVC